MYDVPFLLDHIILYFHTIGLADPRPSSEKTILRDKIRTGG